MSVESVGSDAIEQLEEHRPLAPPQVGELRDVSGPSALGGSWRRGLELLYLIASTDFKRAYFGSKLGYLWTVGRPLMLFGVLLVVFTKGLHLGNAVPHYPVLLLLNIVLFGFFTEGAGTALPSIVSAEAIVRKTQFPRLVIPVAAVLTALFNLALNLIVTFIFILAVGGITPMWSWLLLPVLVGLILVFTVALAMILSSLYPRFRDVAMIWSVASTALFYATPVIYVIDHFSLPLRKILSCNPLAVILELARKWIIDPHAPGPAMAVNSRLFLIIPAAVYVVTCVLAVWVFRREAPRIAEELKPPRLMSAESAERQLRRQIRASHPPLREAVVADALTTLRFRGEGESFGSRLDALCHIVRLAWCSDAFLGQVLYRIKARMLARGIPVAPRIAHRLAMTIAQISIGDPVVVEPGIYVVHGQVVVDGLVRIGAGAVLSPFVTIGLRAGDFNGPTLEPGVQVGTGAKIIGPVRIGEGAQIGANAVVLHDVDAGATVVGIPARRITGRTPGMAI